MVKTKKLIIFGNTLFAQTVCDYFTTHSEYDVVAFTVDEKYIQGNSYYNHQLVAFENIETVYSPNEYDLFVAVGSSRLNSVRENVFNRAKEKGYNLPSFVHPLAYVAPHATIGENCLLMEFAQVMTRSKVGNGVIIWYSVLVNHDNTINDFAYIVGNTAGFTEIGKRTFLGIGGYVGDHIKVGDDNFIAMGSIVRKSTLNNSFLSGNPANEKKLDKERLYIIL